MRSLEKKLKAGYFIYTVYFQELDGTDHGSTNNDNKTIFIDSTRALQCQRETLFHELFHVALDDCPSLKLDYEKAYDREEDIVRFESPRMLQILDDNKWVRDFLFNRDKKELV